MSFRDCFVKTDLKDRFLNFFNFLVIQINFRLLIDIGLKFIVISVEKMAKVIKTGCIRQHFCIIISLSNKYLTSVSYCHYSMFARSSPASYFLDPCIIIAVYT